MWKWYRLGLERNSSHAHNRDSGTLLRVFSPFPHPPWEGGRGVLGGSFLFEITAQEVLWYGILSPAKSRTVITSTPPKNTFSKFAKSSMTLASIKKVPSLWKRMTPFIIIDFIFILNDLFLLVSLIIHNTHADTICYTHFCYYFLSVNLKLTLGRSTSAFGCQIVNLCVIPNKVYVFHF